MQYREETRALGYEFDLETQAQISAKELDRRFTERELVGLRVYRIRWNGNYLIEATFAASTSDSRLQDARALLGEAGTPIHPEDLEDYKKATAPGGALPGWVRRFFGGR